MSTLIFTPGTRPDFVLEPRGPYPEIPTVPTDLAQIQERLTQALEKFDKIDFQALVNSITDAANSIKSLTGSPELKATLESLKGTIANLNQAASRPAPSSITPLAGRSAGRRHSREL
jgi:paraquat-inducible protein B